MAKVSGNGSAVKKTVAQIAGKGTPRYMYLEEKARRETLPSVDWSKSNYTWWDRLRRGQQPGLELAGLLCNPITQTMTAYVVGDSLKAELDPDGLEVAGLNPSEANIRYTNMFLQEWISDNASDLVPFVEDGYALGDNYAFLNPDLSLSVPDPSLVDVRVNPLNYRLIEGYTITTNLDDYIVTDEYTLAERRITIDPKVKTKPLAEEEARRLAGMPREKVTYSFPNMLGRLPVWHLPVERGRNEIFGRPIYSALLELFAHYDDLVTTGSFGAQRMGKPIPAFEGVSDIQAQIDRMKESDTEEYMDRFGSDATRETINWDRDGVIFAPAGATFNFKSPPPGFTTDVRAMLEMLFILVMEHARMPEFMWGGAIASSKASTQTQLPPFVQFIKRLRLLLAGRATYSQQTSPNGLFHLLDLVLRTARLYDPRIVVGPTRLRYPILTTEDGKVMLDKVALAHGKGTLSDLGMLRQLDFDIANPERELEAGREDQQRRLDEEAARLDAYNQQLRARSQPNAKTT